MGFKQRCDLVIYHPFIQQQILIEPPLSIRIVLAPEDTARNKTGMVTCPHEPTFPAESF